MVERSIEHEGVSHGMLEYVEKPPIPNFLLHELVVDNHDVFSVATHETMHGLIEPENVVKMSVIPWGRALGWTLMHNPSDTAIAAGIVHGDGYGKDMNQIARRAINAGIPPWQAIDNATARARNILEQFPPELIELIAKGLLSKEVISGFEFQTLIAQAQWELSYQKQHGHFPYRHESGQKPVTRITEIDKNTIVKPEIPQVGPFILKTWLVDGFIVERYNNGVLIQRAIWLRNHDDEDKYTKLYPWYKREYSPMIGHPSFSKN